MQSCPEDHSSPGWSTRTGHDADGKRVYASSDGDSVVSVISTATDEIIASIDVGSAPHGLAITPDGSRVLVAVYGCNKVGAIDTRTNSIVWKTTVAQPHNLGITPDGRTAYVASQREGHLGWSLSMLQAVPSEARFR